MIFSIIAILVSLALAAVVSNIALRPLEAIGRRLDQMTSGVPDSTPEPDPRRTDEYGMVNTKIDRLGRQIRDVKEVFSALKENLDQIMGTLQDGLVLFTRDTRVVLVSASAERFIGRPRGEILGSVVEGVFTDATGWAASCSTLSRCTREFRSARSNWTMGGASRSRSTSSPNAVSESARC